MIATIDDWLDDGASGLYIDQPLAQDWARISKVSEELGEAVAEFILFTGQNPRKPMDSLARDRMLKELADVVCTATLAIQHFTKDERLTSGIILGNWDKIYARATEHARNG